MGLFRHSYRNLPQVDHFMRELSVRIFDNAHVRRRIGYRRIYDLLRSCFRGVNHKRVERLYKNVNFAAHRRINDVWCIDFVSNSWSNGRRIKFLTDADDLSHECIDIAVDFCISGYYVTRLLVRAVIFGWYAIAVRTDNYLEFTSRAFLVWTTLHGTHHISI